VLSGQATLSPVFLSAQTNLPLGQVDLFIDGNLVQTITNLPPSGGNTLSVTLRGFTVNHTVLTNASVASTVMSLAAALNAQSNSTRVVAYPVGDRLELQGLDATNVGSSLTLNATSDTGSAALPTAVLTSARSTFTDSTATGSAGSHTPPPSGGSRRRDCGSPRELGCRP
jgi:hypothetical protein